MKSIGLGAAAIVLSLSSTALAADYTFIVPHVSNTENYNHLSLEAFKNQVESRSNGRIEVEIYPSGQLCATARECLAGVQNGMFDYFQTTVSEMANYWAPMEGFDLPYQLPSDRVAECVYDDVEFMADVRQEVLNAAEDMRVMMVSNSGGWRNFATTTKQIKTPSDVAGLKIRTVPAPIQQELVKVMDGAPTPISWPETYTALSTGVVDGTKNGIVDIVQMKFHESLKYITLDGHAYMGGLWIMNNTKFESMPEDLQKVVVDAVHAQNQFLRSYPKWREFSAYEEFVEAGGEIYNPTVEERASFRAAAQPVIDQFLANADSDQKEWFNRFNQTIKACEAKINDSDRVELR
ncbi:TRAP transporter substrate-binding protein [Pseudovibrio exalbescens]|uniref:TRAP transporter substrate-binding protein n=1 Tax=Pseudovibrio exalbescens TaxID=197461 RepID=UPI000C9CF5D4|nr:TRAP transporter substrate-binding protein DctP [Pseudovibrio exalbescens]